MGFSVQLAEMRFGYGMSPVVAPPASPEAMLTALAAPDEMATRFPIDSFGQFSAWVVETRKLRKAFQKTKDQEKREAYRAARRAQNEVGMEWAMRAMLRCTHTQSGFRERLVAFWADHFTAKGKIGLLRTATAPYIEDAIRPNVTATFGDMLSAVVTHPLMLHFLDQNRSTGPNSKAVKRNDRLDGLNENLAREVMELHTLGVGGPYSQDDVRQLAELFTGLTFGFDGGFQFRRGFAEPGAEQIMGKSYGGDPARLGPVLEALHDLAVHPVTARHIASKLAVHFVSDTPDESLVTHVTERYLASGGDLMAVYGALLEHPAAWDTPRANVKPPVDFIASGWRALAVDPDHVAQLRRRDMRRTLVNPLRDMGQPWQNPNGPDGWPEQDEAWITPQGVAMRLRWAVSAPQVLCPDLPEPMGFVASTLGDFADEHVQFAARAAESQSDAIGMVLAAPAFQRR